jgi:hypothetical protein
MGRFFDALNAGVQGFKEGTERTDPQAAILICAECGRIEWLAQEPVETSSTVDR